MDFPAGFESHGALIRLGVIDFVYQIPDDWGLNVAERHNFVSSTAQDTTGHGTRVLNILQATASEAEFHLYRTFAESGEFKPQNLLKAFDAARNSQIDVLNLSGGSCRPNCSQERRCRLCDAAAQLARDGVCLVSGAGNRSVEDEKSIFCPARQDTGIAVGSCEAICTADVRPDSPVLGPRMRPPGAYWLDYPSGTDPNPLLGTGCYCGRNGCAPGHSCEDNRIERPSEINIAYERGRPDVLAPDHIPHEQADGSCVIDTGTSYSTPLVAGSLALVIGELFNEGSTPDPSDLKQAVVQSLVSIDEGVVGKFSADKTYHTLSTQK